MALLVVGIGDCKVSKEPSDVLVTHALGSCIAVALYDPVAKVAGLLHYMLPESSLDMERAGKLPCLFADTGISLLLQHTSDLGARKSRLIVVAAGGAQMLEATGAFNIGVRNCLAMQKIFGDAGIRIRKTEIGGSNSRTLSIGVAGGRVRLKTSGQEECDMLAAEGNPCSQ